VRASLATQWRILYVNLSAPAPMDQHFEQRPPPGRQLAAINSSAKTPLSDRKQLRQVRPPQGSVSQEHAAVISPQQFFRRTLDAAAVMLFICTYLSTWSVFFFQSIVVPPSGSGNLAVSTSTGDSAENPQTSFIQRRHKLPVKSVSPIGLHSPTAVLGRAHPRIVEAVPPRSIPSPFKPFQPSHSNRAPPAC